MPTRNYTKTCGERRRIRVTTCEGSVGIALQFETKPTIFTVSSAINLTSAQAVILRELLDKALAEDPFTPKAAAQ